MDKQLNCPRIDGALRAPSSKSEAHRALIVAALSYLYCGASRQIRVRCTDLNQDIEATIRCLRALGSQIEEDGEYLLVTPITVLPESAHLYCGESGSTLRFLLPVCCALGATEITPPSFTVYLHMKGRLPERPLSPLYEELVAHGAILSPIGSNPLAVKGGLSSGDYTLDGGVSSQFISGLLFALPLLGKDSTIRVTGKVESEPYIFMTQKILLSPVREIDCQCPGFYRITGRSHRTAHCNIEDFLVGGDWSGAAFFLAAGLLNSQGSVTVTGLDVESSQGDKAIIDVLRRMGGEIVRNNNGSLTALPSHLHGVEIDASQIPDLVPILAVAASVAEEETVISGASRLRLKESDRLKTVSNMISALGGKITETSDGLIIAGVPRLKGGIVDSAGDHRIAMSGAVASLVCDGAVTVVGAEAVAKSYPKFWEEFEAITV
ncbi:MAG: 3-phosphoshikimate 1-carboxyvinyltransferase [Clostridia bacterium]|nr:3-phosphoshikimate 1-carboxyvinyltransferase [Clostridia bacterium]